MELQTRWTDFLGQLDCELNELRNELSQPDLTGARMPIETLCDRLTREVDTKQVKRMLDEPGKVLLPGWKQHGIVNTGVFDCLTESKYMTRTQADDLHNVFGEAVDFLRDGTTPYKQAEGAHKVRNAINRYLSERGYAVTASNAGLVSAALDSISCPPISDPRTVELLELLRNALDRQAGVPIIELPESVRDSELMTVMVDANLIEFVRRNHCHAGGGPHQKLVLERGWEVADLSKPNRKRVWQLVQEALTEDVEPEIRLRVRLGRAGDVAVATLSCEGGSFAKTPGVDGQAINKAAAWLQAKWIERQQHLPMQRYDENGETKTTEHFAPVTLAEFHQYLLSIGAPVAATVDECRRQGWVDLMGGGIGIARQPTDYWIRGAVNAVRTDVAEGSVVAVREFKPRAMMEKAIDLMLQSKNEPRQDGKASPKVGAVLIVPNELAEGRDRLITGFRGELRLGDHAEYTLLERKCRDWKLDGSVLFTTLEPCAPGARNHPKLPCAERIVLARIKEVWVGIEDPDPSVDRKGIKFLEDNHITVHMFDADLQEKIREENKVFIRQALERAAAVQEQKKPHAD